MAYNRELSQFSSLLQIDDSSKVIGIATNMNVSGIVSATFYYGSGQYLTGLIAQAIPAGSAGQMQYNEGVSLGATSTFVVNQSNFNVGIGTTNATSKLTVFGGDVYVSSGVVTASNFYGNLTGTATTSIDATNAYAILGSPNLNVGVVTATDIFSNVSGENLLYTGISTFSSLTGPVLIGTAISTGSLDQYLQVGGNSYISGNLGIGSTNATSKLQVVGDVLISGVSTLSGITTVTGTTLFTRQLSVSGVSTLNGITTVTGTTLFTRQVNVSGASTFVNGPLVVGSAVTTGTAFQTLQSFGGGYIAGNAGIGSTNPGSRLAVIGDAFVSGVVTATTFSGTATTATNATNAYAILGSPNLNVGVVTATSANVTGDLTALVTRFQSVSEKTNIIAGNTVNLVYNTGGGNIAICTTPSGSITLNVTGIPTIGFDNTSISFTVIIVNSGIARSCNAINLNGVSRTIRWQGGSITSAQLGVTTSNGYDFYNFVGLNTVGSGATTANYEIFGTVNGNFR